MLQRNTSGGALLLTTLNPPLEVPPGGEIDHPDLLAGFIPVDDTPPAAPAPVPAKATKPAAAAAGDSTTSEGATK